MTIELRDAINGDGLFDVLGKAFYALQTLNTAMATTVPAEVEDILTQFATLANAATLDWEPVMEGLPASVDAWKASSGTITAQIRLNCQNLLIQFVLADTGRISTTLDWSLDYLIDQMTANGDYVTGNTITLTLAATVGNNGDPAICYSTRRGDGQVNQNILAEAIAVEVSTAGTEPVLRFQGLPARSDRLDVEWPAGSGCDVSITATDPAGSLLSNGDFQDATNTDIPDDWIVQVGVVGTTVRLSLVETQTIAISGTPTGGTYLVQYTSPGSKVYSTGTLTYDATASTLQTELRLLPGLEAVDVTATGTSPDYTHTIVFTGVAGDVGALSTVSHLTGGTPVITQATTQVGEPSYSGRSLVFDSDGAELSAVYHALDGLDVDTVYFCHVRMRVGPLSTSTISAGELRIEIMDGIGGSVTTDSDGNANSLTIDATAISSTEDSSYFFSFRLKPSVVFPVYLRIRISQAIDSGSAVYIDEAAIAEGTELYAGGPFVAVFGGATPAIVGDTWTLTATNNRAGKLQEWMNRVFSMDDSGYLLPVSGSTSGLIPESVIS